MGKARRGRLCAVVATVTAIVCYAVPAAAGASFTESTDVDTNLTRLAPTDFVGQSFTVPAGSEGFLHTLKILKFTKTSGTYQVFLIDVDVSGFPTGTFFYSSPMFSGAFGPGTLTLYPNATLTPGARYAFYTQASGATFGAAGSNAYSFGSVVVHNGTSNMWGTEADDIGFRAEFSSGRKASLTTVSCPGPGKIGQPTACTATLQDGATGSGLNGSQVVLSSLSGTGSFSDDCTVNSVGSCSFNFTPALSGADTIFGQFVGNATYLDSASNTGITVNKRNSEQTDAACSPTTVHVGETATCFVTVSDTDSGTKTTPSGATSWSSSGTGTFAAGGSCPLAPEMLGVARCDAIAYTPTAPGSHGITSSYAGDAAHLASTSVSAGTLTVQPAPLAVVPTPVPDCGGVLSRISSLRKKLQKAHGQKRKKLKKKLRKLRSQATALGC